MAAFRRACRRVSGLPNQPQGVAALTCGDWAALDGPPPPPPTLDDIDVTRHREITSKAVSAILLLTLKWFKVSRESSRGPVGASR